MNKKLYVKIPKEFGENMDKLINIISKYPGEKETVVHIEATKSNVVAGGSYKVTYTKYLIKNLEEAFGVENVVLKDL